MELESPRLQHCKKQEWKIDRQLQVHDNFSFVLLVVVVVVVGMAVVEEEMTIPQMIEKKRKEKSTKEKTNQTRREQSSNEILLNSIVIVQVLYFLPADRPGSGDPGDLAQRLEVVQATVATAGTEAGPQRCQR